MPLTDELYLQNQAFISVLGLDDNKIIRVSICDNVRNNGVEAPQTKRGEVHNEKLSNNLSRARKKIYEYAMCNEWDYFFTGTFNPSKYDRSDLNGTFKQYSQWIRNNNRLHSCKIEYILIPEKHADGNCWHLHGLIRGIPKEQLKQFVIGDTMGKGLADKVKKGEKVFNWLTYSEKFGFCDLEPIKNHNAVSCYLLKYITKDMSRCVSELNAHLYYCSKGLKSAERIKHGSPIQPLQTVVIPSNYYKHDYGAILDFRYTEENLNKLISAIRSRSDVINEEKRYYTNV